MTILKTANKRPGEFLFASRRGPNRSITTRQYARLVSEWIGSVGLDPRLVGADRVVKVDYKGGEQTITIPTDATVVAFVKAPSASELVVGRKVFVVMKKDSPEAAAVVIGAEGIKPPRCNRRGGVTAGGGLRPPSASWLIRFGGVRASVEKVLLGARADRAARHGLGLF
jgi:hypothetical protein